MPATATAAPRTKEMDDWLISLDPNFKALLQDGPNSPPAAEAEPRGGGPAKLATELDVLTLKLIDHPTKYGSIKVTGTLKASTTTAAEGETSKTYTATDAKHRERGVKKAFSLAEQEKAGLLGFELTNIKLELETEFSGGELVVGTTMSFELATKLFNQPAKSSTKVILLKYSKEAGFQLPSIELSVVQAPTIITTGAVATTISAEIKGGYAVDKAKILKEIGKDVIKKIAKDALEKEAKRLGVKFLGREAGEMLLKDLGPVAAAFSVGLDIGGLLNEYTVAPKVAGAVDDAILGDLNERYQAADTLGKMWLISKNSPKIVAALVASGVAGAAAGISDVVLFKLLGLPTAEDFKESLKEFQQGITAAIKAIHDAVEQGIGGTMLYGALMLGIKYNPKHAICAHGALEPVIAAIFAKLRPLYRPNGYEKIIMVRVGDASFDRAGFEKFAKFAVDFKMQYGGAHIDLTDEKAMAKSLEALLLAQFLGFLEANKMIRYNVKTDGNMDPDDIDPKLLDELFG